MDKYKVLHIKIKTWEFMFGAAERMVDVEMEKRAAKNSQTQ